MKVLVVEDDRPLRTILGRILQDEGFEVDLAEDGREGLLYGKSEEYDLFILDIMMPELDGYELIKELRAAQITGPALFLTAKDSVEDKVKGLDLGADDYIVKPFESRELLARIRSLLRRAGKLAVEGKLQYGKLALDPASYQAYFDGEPVTLTKKEFELLHYLVLNKGQILTRSQIFDRIWGLESETGEGIVDLYIHYLRKKFSTFDQQQMIHTVRGVGYMLKGTADV